MVGPEDRVYDWTRQTRVEKFKLLVIACICIRSCLILFLQGQYIWMQSNYQSNPTTFEFRQVEEHRLLMRKCGITFREWGATAMLGFSACFACLAIFILGDKLTNGRISSKYQADLFVMFYTNPRLADRRLTEAFNSYLKWMIFLNEKKMFAIVNNSRLSIFDATQTNQLIADLNEQQAQLRHLLNEKSSIRPANRIAKWRQEQTRFFLNIYMFIYVPVYCGVILLSLAGSWITDKQAVEMGETPLFIMERIGFIEIYLATYLGFEKYTCPMILLVVNLRDKRLFWSSIQSKFKVLKLKLAKLRIATDYYERSANQSIEDNRKERLHLMRTECDAEALRIYLSLRVFLDELKPTTELASTIAKQYCSMALIMLLLTLPFFTNSSWVQISADIGILVATVSIINAAFLVCALFESGCIAAIQNTWSLVASLVRDVDSPRYFSKPPQAFRAEYLKRLAQTSIQASSAESFRYKSEFFFFSSPCSSLISEHTAILWRRFLEDMPIMHRSFSFKIFDIVNLNYRGMMRLNFWFISVVLIFRSQLRFT